MNDWRSIPIEVTNQLMQKFKKMNEENTIKFKQQKQAQLQAEQTFKEEKESLIKRKKELEQIHNLQTNRLNTELIECRKKELLHIQTIEKLRNDLERKSNINELCHQENFQKLHEQYQQFVKQHNDCEDISRQFMLLQQNQFQLQNTIQNLQSDNTKLNKDLQFQKQLSKTQQEQSKEQNQIINSLKTNIDQLRDRNKEIIFKQHLSNTAKNEVQYRSVDLKQEDKQQEKNLQIIQQLTQRIKDLETEQHTKLEAMQSEYQTKINNLQKTLLQIKKEAQELEGLMNDRDAQLSTIQSDSEQQLKQLHHLEQKLISAEQDHQQKNNQLLEQNNLIDLLKFEKAQFQSKIEELNSQIQLQQVIADDSENQSESQPIDFELIQHLKQQLNAAQEENQGLLQQLETKEFQKSKLEEIQQQQLQIATNFQNQIKELQDIIEVKDQMVFNNQTECDLQIQKLESEHSMKQEWLDLQIQEQTELIEQMEETIKQLQQENEEMSKTIEQQKQSAQLQSQPVNDNKDSENYQKELDKLKELLQQKDEIIFTNQSESDVKLQKAESEFQMKIQWADLSSQEMNEQIAELEEQKKLLQTKFTDQILSLQEQVNQKTKSLQENSDQIATLNGELITFKFKCKELEEQCQQLQIHNSDLQKINNDNDLLEVETIILNKQQEIQLLQQQLQQKQQQLKSANDNYLNLELKFNLQTQDLQSQIDALKQCPSNPQQIEKSDTAEYYEKINRLLVENEEFKNLQNSNHELQEELTHKDQLISELQMQMLSQSQVTGDKDFQQRQKTHELLTKLKDDKSDVSVGSLKSAKSRQETQELFKKITKMSMYTAHYMSSKLDYASLDQPNQGEQEPIEEESIQQEQKQQQQQQQEEQI